MNDKDLDQTRKAIRAEMASYFFDLARKKRNIRIWVKDAWDPVTAAHESLCGINAGQRAGSLPSGATTPYEMRLDAAILTAKARMVEMFGYEEDESILNDEDRLAELAARLLYLEAVK